MDNKNSLWISSPDGLYFYNTISGEFNHYAHDPSDYHSVSYSAINNLYFDNDRLLWIGGENSGVEMVNISGSFFEYFPLKPSSNEENPYTATSFCEDSYGFTWVGTVEAGLFKFNEMNLVDQFMINDKREECKWCNFIYTIYEDPDNTLWIGTFNNGLYKFSKYENKLKKCLFKADKEYYTVYRINDFYTDSFGWSWTGGTIFSGLAYQKPNPTNEFLFEK